MNFVSHDLLLLLLAATSVLFSRTLLLSFNDPEGTNLLVSTIGAIGFFLLSLLVFKMTDRYISGFLHIVLVIVFQCVLAFGLFLFLK